jgi:hypothetical protein
VAKHAVLGRFMLRAGTFSTTIAKHYTECSSCYSKQLVYATHVYYMQLTNASNDISIDVHAEVCYMFAVRMMVVL